MRCQRKFIRAEILKYTQLQFPVGPIKVTHHCNKLNFLRFAFGFICGTDDHGKPENAGAQRTYPIVLRLYLSFFFFFGAALSSVVVYCNKNSTRK